MNAFELLDTLNRHAVGLEVHGDKLRARAPKGVLTGDLLDALRRHKEQIIAILAAPDGETIPRRSGDAPVPLSPAQRQLWILDQLAPGQPLYNNPLAVDIRGALDVAALAASLTAVVGRHEALRTTFSTVDAEPVQVVHPAGPVPLPVEDLTGLDPTRRAERAAAATAADARTPFDLATGPLLRSRLLRVADDAYVWLLCVHHIVADGWSIGLLLREVSELYRAAVTGTPADLPVLAVQYPDYTLWQRATAPDLDRQLAYWTTQLADAPALLDLPTDRPRPAVPSSDGDCLIRTVDRGVVDRLHAIARASDATLFMTLTATFAALLGRLSGQRDLCLGTPFANRDHHQVESLIGHFVSTAVIRTRPDPARSLRDLLAEVRRDTLDAYANPDVPFDRLVEALRPERHPSWSPLFQVLLVLQNMPRGHLDLPGVTLRPRPTGTGTARFDLALEAAEVPDGLELTFEYRSDLFDRATVDRLADQLVRFLAQVADDPDTPIGALRLLDPAERDRLVRDWNATSRPDRRPVSLIERFEANADAHPDRLALVDGEVRLDYSTVERRANRIAHDLIARGVSPDQVVGVRSPRSAGLVVALLGILKAAAAYLPLDPALPDERLAAMVDDAGATLVLDEADLAAPSTGDDGEDPGRPGIPIVAGRLAYVISTSGSTGRPKGVALTHAGITNVFEHWLEWLGPEPADQPASAGAAIGFDASVWEILLPLAGGGALHLVPEDVRLDPTALMAWLAEHRIAQATLPPPFLRWIAEDPERRLAGLRLRNLVVGVEPLPEDGLHRMTEVLPGLRVLNIYGPTETTVYSTAYPDPGPRDRQCPIGAPLTETRLYVLDPRLEPVPVGVTGELYIAGVGLARGYLGRPDLTAERFVPDPFVPGERMYRTGDHASWLPDGNLMFAGRRDHQIKLRGFRVELGEIEATLLDEPDVREAVVVLDTGDDGEPRLVAGIGREAADPRPAAEWRAILARRLPSYMLPAVVVERPSLPQTANGKVDRDALRRLARTQTSDQVNLHSPRDHVELVLYQLWTRLLTQTDIGIRDSFFDVGGSSISAIKLAHAIEESFGQTLSVREIMLHPTIEALGARLRAGAPDRPPSNLITFRAGAGERHVVCVHPAGGTAFCYLALAKVLPATVGVHGIQSPGVNPGEAMLPTVEAMAEEYLRLIDGLGGALLLTGLSYGGLVAHEMGQRLASAGQRVGVVLLDTLGLDDPTDRAQVAPVDLAEFRSKLVRFNGMYPGIDDEHIEQYFRIYNHNRLTMRDYDAPPSPARTVLVQATTHRDDTFLDDVRAFWQRRATGGFEVRRLDCDHWELLESAQVRAVAAVITDELSQVDP